MRVELKQAVQISDPDSKSGTIKIASFRSKIYLNRFEGKKAICYQTYMEPPRGDDAGSTVSQRHAQRSKPPIHSGSLPRQLQFSSLHTLFPRSKLDQRPQYCTVCITSSTSLTRLPKSAIDRLEVSVSPFRRFSSAASFPNNILCTSSTHFFMSRAFQSSGFKPDSSLSHSHRFAPGFGSRAPSLFEFPHLERPSIFVGDGPSVYALLLVSALYLR